jgi:ADP-ribosylation factor family
MADRGDAGLSRCVARCAAAANAELMAVGADKKKGFFRSFKERVTGSKDGWVTLLMGLDSSGKTTTLYKLKLGEVQSCFPPSTRLCFAHPLYLSIYLLPSLKGRHDRSD